MNGSVLTHELKDQLEDAAVTTSKAFSQVRHQRTEEVNEAGNPQPHATHLEDVLAEKGKEKAEKKISPEIIGMKPILRFLQLLCENHNRDLQVNSL